MRPVPQTPRRRPTPLAQDRRDQKTKSRKWSEGEHQIAAWQRCGERSRRRGRWVQWRCAQRLELGQFVGVRCFGLRRSAGREREIGERDGGRDGKTWTCAHCACAVVGYDSYDARRECSTGGYEETEEVGEGGLSGRAGGWAARMKGAICFAFLFSSCLALYWSSSSSISPFCLFFSFLFFLCFFFFASRSLVSCRAVSSCRVLHTPPLSSQFPSVSQFPHASSHQTLRFATVGYATLG